MIINSFDDKSEPVLKPEYILKRTYEVDVCIITFKGSLFNMVKEKYNPTEIGITGSANGKGSIYLLNIEDKEIAFYLSPVGSVGSATTLIETHTQINAKKYIVFGSCGILDEKCKNKIIIPTHAYRDEGFSYHYMPPSDFIEMKCAGKLEKIIKALNIDYVVGKTWTTDAIYMETQNKINDRKSLGCITVEMEASALEAATEYLGTKLYLFLFSGDILYNKYDRSSLGGQKEYAKQLNSFDIALEIAKRI